MNGGHLRVTSMALAALALAAATALAGFSGTDVFLPSVGAKPGVPPAVWYTTVWVYNPGTAPANITVYLLERKANTAPLTYTGTVPPGDTTKYDNAVQSMFAKQVFGALRITSNQKVIVSSRVYSQQGSAIDESTGQFFAGVPASFAIGAGASTEIIGAHQTQPASSSDFRFNFGFVEVTGTGTCQVKVTVKDGTGAVKGSKTYTVRQWEQVQKQFADEFPSISSDNARLTVEVLSGAGKVIAFGSGVANGSQDASTFEMAYADSLLAENSSAGITGVTAGAGLTGGGSSGSVTLDVGAGSGIQVDTSTVSIADGGVTTAKLSPAGSTNGKVLKSNGSAVVWGDDLQGGLTLPYSETVLLSGQAAFHVANSGATLGTWAVEGEAPDPSGGGGVYGVSKAGPGVQGYSLSAIGVSGYSEGTSGAGVVGQSTHGVGVRGLTLDQDEAGVLGQGPGKGVLGSSSVTSSWGYLGGEEGVYGVHGTSANFGMLGTSDQGVYGEHATKHTKGSFGSANYGVYARQNDGTHAGYFNGNMQVNGTLTATSKSFKIDHPLDPANKYLYHVSVESPDMKNMYDGVVTTDEDGFATVELPEWFEALNRDFRYQLTVIGGGDEWVFARVVRKIANNSFVIQTSAPQVEVSWLVTGIRQDPWANAHRTPLEEDKPEKERGYYLNPDVWGQPSSREIGWATHPELMNPMRRPEAPPRQEQR